MSDSSLTSSYVSSHSKFTFKYISYEEVLELAVRYRTIDPDVVQRLDLMASLVRMRYAPLADLLVHSIGEPDDCGVSLLQEHFVFTFFEKLDYLVVQEGLHHLGTCVESLQFL